MNSKYLARHYSFQSHSSLNYYLPEFDRLELILKEWLAAFGYTEGNAFTLRTVYNFGCLCLIVAIYFALRDILRKKEKYSLSQRVVAVFFVVAALIYSIFIICTDFTHVGRYCLPVAVFAIPVLTIYFSRMQDRKVSRTVSVMFCTLMLLCSLGKLRNQFQQDNTAELRNLSEMLISEGYEQGYSTFWTGNLVTELSNGEIEMWILSHSMNSLENVYPWLQAKEHGRVKPEGKVFLLFEKYEMHDEGFAASLDKEKIVYESDTYTVFCYESHEAVLANKS